MVSNIWKIYLMEFFSSFLFLGAILVPFFTDWGKLSYSQVLSLQSWFMVCCFVFEFPSGAFADRFGKKLSLSLGLLFCALGFLTYASIANFWIFVLAEMIIALGNSLLSGTVSSFISATLIALKQKHRKKEVLGRGRGFSLVGILSSAIVGSILVPFVGFQGVVLLSSLSPLIAFFVSLTLVEPKNGEKKESFGQITREGIICFKKSKALIMITIDKTVVQILCFFLVWIYQPFLREEGIEIVYFGSIHALICLVQIIVLFKLFELVRVFKGAKNFFLFSAFVPALSFCFIGVDLGNIFFQILGLLLISGLGIPRSTLSVNYMLEHIEEAYQTTALSFAEMFRKIFTAILYPVVGIIMDRSINLTFLIIGVTLFVYCFIPILKKEYLLE